MPRPRCGDVPHQPAAPPTRPNRAAPRHSRAAIGRDACPVDKTARLAMFGSARAVTERLFCGQEITRTRKLSGKPPTVAQLAKITLARQHGARFLPFLAMGRVVQALGLRCGRAAGGGGVPGSARVHLFPATCGCRLVIQHRPGMVSDDDVGTDVASDWILQCLPYRKSASCPRHPFISYSPSCDTIHAMFRESCCVGLQGRFLLGTYPWARETLSQSRDVFELLAAGANTRRRLCHVCGMILCGVYGLAGITCHESADLISQRTCHARAGN